MIQKVIFDFDDTITNNQLLDYMAFNIPFKKSGISTLTKTEIQKSRKKGLLAKDIILPHLKNHDSDIQKRFFLIRTEFLNSIKSADYLRPQKNLKVLLENLEQKKINCVQPVSCPVGATKASRRADTWRGSGRSGPLAGSRRCPSSLAFC